MLDFYKLSQNGFANLFYAAAVKSDLLSLSNFFFVSFDPGGLDSIDKPPLAIWLQTLSAKLFGFTPLALITPEGVCAMLAVALLYFIVAKRLGILAASRVPRPSRSSRVRCRLARERRRPAAPPLHGGGVRSRPARRRHRRTRWLLASALLVGLAFNTKSLAALLCVPGIGLAYLLCAQVSWRRRALQLLAGAVVLCAVAVSWSLAVDLTPAAQRPYVGGSTNNSELQLEFGYNGFGRAGGQVGGPPCPAVYAPPTSDVRSSALPDRASAHPHPPDLPVRPVRAVRSGPIRAYRRHVRNPQHVPFASCKRGPLRIFDLGLGDQAGWTVPFAVAGLLGLALLAGGWRSRRTALLFAFGGWFVLELGFLDYSKGIVHPYYASALGPPLAAMVGGAVFCDHAARSQSHVVACWRRTRPRAAAALGTVAAELYEIHNHGYPHFMRTPLIVAAVASHRTYSSSARRAASWPGLPRCCSRLRLLATPLIYTTSVLGRPVDRHFPTAGLYNEAGWGGIKRCRQMSLRRSGAGRIYPNASSDARLRSPDPVIRRRIALGSSSGSAAAAMGGYQHDRPGAQRRWPVAPRRRAPGALRRRRRAYFQRGRERRIGGRPTRLSTGAAGAVVSGLPDQGVCTSSTAPARRRRSATPTASPRLPQA